MRRRTFVKNAGLVTAGLALSEIAAATAWQPGQNKLPKWKGFNLLDFFHQIQNQQVNLQPKIISGG